MGVPVSAGPLECFVDRDELCRGLDALLGLHERGPIRLSVEKPEPPAPDCLGLGTVRLPCAAERAGAWVVEDVPPLRRLVAALPEPTVRVWADLGRLRLASGLVEVSIILRGGA